MRKKVLRSITFLLLALFAAATSVNAAEWTFMVYLDGDNNLEPAAIKDFLEMSEVGSDDNVNILVLMDRISSYDSSYGNWTGTRRGIINKGDAPDTSWGISMGELNMGDPDSLYDFINWGTTNYPANNYAIILWNHGGGWRSASTSSDTIVYKDVCYDDTSGEDCLYTSEVKDVLAELAKDGISINLIGYDACLMGMVEVAYEVRKYADVMVASSDNEPDDGWPYTEILYELTDNPDMSASALGSVIVDEYFASYDNDYTMAALDLSVMDSLANSIYNLSDKLMNSWASDGAACVSAASSVISSLSLAIIDEAHGSYWPDAHGLAINFPSYGADSDYNSYVIDFPGATNWDDFLDYFSNNLHGTWIDDAAYYAEYYSDQEFKDLYSFCENLISLYDGSSDDNDGSDNDDGNIGTDISDSWSAPSGYYDSVTPGANLRIQLESIMSTGHSVTSYDDFKYISSDFDTDPDNRNKILLCYDRSSVYGDWDSGNSWNREHLWPHSRQPSSGFQGDPHSLRPCDPDINSRRGNLPFGGETLTGSFRKSGSYWFPGDADKGDVARSMFYYSTRYNMKLVNGTPSGYEMGDLASLLRWHYKDIPDDFERYRNHIIYSEHTNNRNAYIDHPEYVWSVYGGNDNDTQIYVGDSADSDGGSELAITLDSDSNTEYTITINKTGNDGTYYYIGVSGDISSSVTGRLAFDYGTQSKSITITLATSANLKVGDVAGTVTITNMDVSTASPNGCGSNDSEDVVTVYYVSNDNGNDDTGLVGDVDDDGWVDINDLAAIASDWLVDYPGGCPEADLTGDDCFVDIYDFAILASAWGNTLYTVVPDIVGEDYAVAAAIIEADELAYEVQYSYSEYIEPDQIISTSPVAGEQVLIGSTIVLVVSLGEEQITTVPELYNTAYSSVVSTLTASNLILGSTTESYSSTVSEGNIISQSPASGAVVGYGTSVDVVVSLGQEPVTESFVIITGILDGNMGGGTPKCVELYVNGTVNLSDCTIKNLNNGDSSPTAFETLSGTYTNEFVYIVNSGSITNFESCFGDSGDFGNMISVSALAINGDDCVALYDSNNDIVDVYGVIGVDGSGTNWEYKDGYAIRNDGGRPMTTFRVSDWSVNNNSLGGNASEYSEIVPFGKYTK